jgi:hypothetical protein
MTTRPAIDVFEPDKQSCLTECRLDLVDRHSLPCDVDYIDAADHDAAAVAAREPLDATPGCLFGRLYARRADDIGDVCVATITRDNSPVRRRPSPDRDPP